MYLRGKRIKKVNYTVPIIFICRSSLLFNLLNPRSVLVGRLLKSIEKMYLIFGKSPDAVQAQTRNSAFSGTFLWYVPVTLLICIFVTKDTSSVQILYS